MKMIKETAKTVYPLVKPVSLLQFATLVFRVTLNKDLHAYHALSLVLLVKIL